MRSFGPIAATYSNETCDLSLLWTHIGKTAIEPYLPTPEQPHSTP